MIHALVAGGGDGERFGGPKWRVPLAGRRVLDYALRPLAMCDSEIRSVTLLLPERELGNEPPPWLAGMDFQELAGGASRAESVMRGLEALRERADAESWVLVHDVARPCVWQADVARLLRARSAGGGLLAVPVTDSVKCGEDGCVARSIDRRGLWRAQTPQLFRLADLHQAMVKALHDEVEVTDESSAMEYCGHRPQLVQGSEDNIKLTWPEDLPRAERILQDDPDHAYWARL